MSVRNHVVEARRSGVRVGELAETLGVSPSLISYWARSAGIAPFPREMARPCGACAHPRREAIDVALITMTVANVAVQFPDLTHPVLDRHRRLHVGLTGLGQHAAHRSCAACISDQRDLIDQALDANQSRTRLAETTGIARHVLRHHQKNHLDNVGRDMAQASAAVRRLAVLRKVAADGIERR